jgi:hypothetical protein
MKADLVRSMAVACRELEQTKAELLEYVNRAVEANDMRLLWGCVSWATEASILVTLATTLRDTIAGADCFHDEHLN